MPVKARTEMLTIAVRTPIGVKISGSDLRAIERVGAEIQTLLQTVEGTRSVFAERTGGGYFLDIEWKREELARSGLSLDDAQAVVRSAARWSRRPSKAESAIP